jgi:O-glycosyl hydrolase
MGEGLYWANLIYTGIVNANLSAYLYWEGAEADAATNSCLIQISGTIVTASARMWAMAQWSRYVRPGALRVATSGSTSTLKTSAFKNTDGTASIQVINMGSSAQAVSIAVSGGTFGSVTAYVSQ